MSRTSADPILRRLREGTASSPELQQLTGSSQPTVSRRLRELLDEGRIIRIGSRRGARYALLRNIEGIDHSWPLRLVDSRGTIETLGNLHALSADEYYLDSLPNTAVDISGITQGIPYFLQDQRPAGFLGRAVPQRYPELGLPQRVIDWTDDHYLRYLTRRGGDTLGDLIIGDESLDQHLALQRQRERISVADRGQRYPSLASDVMEGGLPGSSAHGEHPKFAALHEDTSGPRHVLVKFSPPLDTAIGQRWSDLLVAEHVAHMVLRESGIAACESQVMHYRDRAFLEVVRFDRQGAAGRLGVTSLFAIDTYRYGKLDHWLAAATRLHADRCITPAALEDVRLLSAFGDLIANTDRHFGNLAFFDRYDGNFVLAPVYDMLPMLYAPEHGQLIDRVFAPPPPSAQTFSVYSRVNTLAQEYWRRIADDRRVSAGFRALSATNAEAVRRLRAEGL
jgi:hypothetical protein